MATSCSSFASCTAPSNGRDFNEIGAALDRDVAIKILPDAFAHDADRLARFQREAKIPEHLVALAFQAGGHKRRERAWQMLEVGVVDRQRLRTLLSAHGIMMEVDDGT